MCRKNARSENIHDPAFSGMRLDFVDNVQMDVVAYTTTMNLNDTFGAAIRSMCTAREMHEQEWDFLFHALFTVPKNATPDEMGMVNADVATIYCQPANATN